MTRWRPKSIPLGTTQDGRTIYIDPKTRKLGIQIIGSSGEGKTKLIEHFIRHDIINEDGGCSIDPHGYSYKSLVRWCETKHMLGRKKIILFDPSEQNWAFGFNPLKVSSPDLAYHVDAMVKAVAKVWGGEDTDKTPLLKRCLRVLFYTLAEKELSLLEAQHLLNPINPTHKAISRYLTRDIEDLNIRDQWDYFNTLDPRRFYEEFASTTNRLMEFLSSPIIRNTIGQLRETIDFRKIMDEGYFLLVNLATGDKISEDNARLLGTLIVNELFMTAKGRPEGSRPFYLYIDECGRFINEDIGRILDEGRKFGLHLILAHQHLAQLKKAGEEVYKAVMTDAKAKAIFGGLTPEDARILAEQVFLGELDLEDPKESLNKPIVTGYIKTWLRNYSESTGYAETRDQGSSETETITYDSEGKVLTTTKASGFSARDAYTQSWQSATGATEALEPVLEERPTQVHSLEEQIYRAMALMVNQPTQHAIIKLPKRHTEMVKTPTIKDGYANDQRVLRFKEECYQLADFAKPKLLVEQELDQRRLLLKEKAYQPLPEPEDWKE